MTLLRDQSPWINMVSPWFEADQQLQHNIRLWLTLIFTPFIEYPEGLGLDNLFLGPPWKSCNPYPQFLIPSLHYFFQSKSKTAFMAHGHGHGHHVPSNFILNISLSLTQKRELKMLAYNTIVNSFIHCYFMATKYGPTNNSNLYTQQWFRKIGCDL